MLWYGPRVGSFTLFTPPGAAAGLLAALLVASAPGAGGGALPEQEREHPEIVLPVAETALRRDRLVDALRKELGPAEKGLFLFSGAGESDLLEFRQSSDFFYLTGLETPGAALLITFDAGASSERLYLTPRDEEAEKWSGPGLAPGGTAADGALPDDERLRTQRLTGLRGEAGSPGSGVRDRPALREDLSRLAGPGLVLFEPGEPGEEGGSGLGQDDLAALQAPDGAPLRRASARAALTRLRLVKSESERAAIRRAVEITCEGQRAAMRALAPGAMEFEIEAVVEYEFTRAGARFSAFPTIVGSGPNSCVLHYSRNSRRIEEGDLVVIDAGAEFGRYAADVTRTLPASGVFDPEQARIYAAVLEAQRAGIDLARPGARIRDVNERVKSVLEERGLDKHILHGCCHFVGLDVHDVGDRDVVLEPGMVLTVEPGLYIPEKGIGVRIEDTLLVTPEGNEILSACVPKNLDEIRAEMALGGERPALRSGASEARRP